MKVLLKTFGCQMNEYDSQVAAGLLEHDGFQMTDRASEADVILMNTCSVREHAEDRVYGRLGMLGKAKRTNPDLIVGLLGCMVEEHREKLFTRFPQLDLMVGTRNIKELPALIDQVRQTRKQAARIRQDGISIEYTDLIKRENAFHAWLPIMTGCDKVCTYCIVPLTRGREVSMPAREVYREASRLVKEGVKWITLLGQNVNSYRGETFDGIVNVGAGPCARPKANGANDERAPTGGRPYNVDGKNISFPELLNMLCQIDGLGRISFTTSHPHDATEELFRVIAKNQKISRRFHLPLQSGSNRILKRMKRLHTYEEYKAKIDLMRELIPDVSITTDIIAGFSGETEEDHAATLKALSEIQYDGAYVYKYSVRAATPAAKLSDDVLLMVKQKRNAELLQFQNQMTKEANRKWLGKIVQVFVEGTDSRNPNQLTGRTDQDKTVVFQDDSAVIGSFQKVRLDQLHNETFLGMRLS